MNMNANAYNINSPAPSSRRKPQQQYQQSPSSYNERSHQSTLLQTTQQPSSIFSARGVLKWPLPTSLISTTIYSFWVLIVVLPLVDYVYYSIVLVVEVVGVV